MHLRIGVLGLGLVIAFVAGGLAEAPPEFNLDQNQPSELPTTALPPSQVGGVSAMASTTLGGGESIAQVGAAGELIGFNGFTGSGSQTITLVHAGKMQIAVYHIDSSGKIRLVSSRPIDADFSLSLNVTAPLPGQIRLLGGQVK